MTPDSTEPPDRSSSPRVNSVTHTGRAKQVVALLLANGANLLISFLTLPYLARSLSYEDYGTYGQLNLIGNVVTVLFSLGAAHVANVIYVEYQGREERVFSTNFWTFLYSGSLALTIVWLLKEPISQFLNNEKLVDLIPAYGVFILIQVGSSLYGTTIVFFGRTRGLALITVLSNLVRVGMMIVAISFFESLHLAVWALSISAALQAAGYFFVVPRSVRRVNAFEFAIFFEQLKLAYPMLAVAMLGTGVFQIDGLVVSYLLGVEDFAIFRAGAIEIPFIATIFGTVATVLMPDVARLAAERRDREIFELNRRSSSVTAIAVVPITLALIFFGEELITLYLSEKYVASGIVFSIYNIAVLMRLTLFQATLLAHRRTKDILSCFVVGIIISVVLNLLFVRWFGVVGAAAVHPITTFVLVSLLTLRTIRVTRQPLANFFDWAFLGILFVVSATILIGIKVVHISISSYPLVACLLILYGIIILALVRSFRPDYYALLFLILRRKDSS